MLLVNFIATLNLIVLSVSKALIVAMGQVEKRFIQPKHLHEYHFSATNT